MASLAEYFDKVTYKPTYFIGDRVRGIYNGIPFSGTVGNDTLVNEDEGPYVIVHLDLPIQVDSVYINLIKIKHDCITTASLLNKKKKNATT